MNPALLRAGGRIATAGALVALLAANAISNAPQPPDGSEATQLLGGLPLSFVENRGQWDTPARFVAKRGPMVARLEQDALVVELRDGSDPENPKALILRLAFENVSEDVRLEGEGQQPGVRNYFLGNDPEAWRAGVPGFDSVLYRGLQDGIDLRVRDRDGRLEYDLLLAPGADLGAFTVRCEGVEGIAVEPDGSLVLQTALGPVQQTPPATWYVLPTGDREPVDCRFALTDEARYGFEIPDRYPDLPVVIDPGLEWSTFLGGSLDDSALDLKLDPTGRAIVSGRTRSSDFPTLPGAHDTLLDGPTDGFVACLDPRLSDSAQLCWATYLGGSEFDRVMRSATDGAGDIYLVGETSSADFPWTVGAYDTTHNGTWDAFVTKLDSTGSNLLYSTFLGGAGYDDCLAIALQDVDRVAVGGTTSSDDFPTTPGAYDQTHNGGLDSFIALLDLELPGVGALVYSSFLGGSSTDGLPPDHDSPVVHRSMDVAVDRLGDLVVTGETGSEDFPTTPDAYSGMKSGLQDIYLSRLSPDGNGPADLVYSTFVGGPREDRPFVITLDPLGSIWVAGITFFGEGFPVTAGAYDTSFNGYVDAFVFDLDPSQTGQQQLVYSTYLGAGESDGILDLALHGSGDLFLTGWTGDHVPNQNQFPTTCGAYDTTFNGYLDAFFAVLSPDGQGADDLIYSTYVGAAEEDGVFAAELLPSASTIRVVASNWSNSPTFPTTPGAFQPFLAGGFDAAVLSIELTPQWSTYCSTAPNSVGPGAQIGALCSGSASIGDNTFELSATGAIPNQFGLFYYGPEQQQVPFGDGFQCVAPGTVGLFRLNPPQVIDPSGVASRLVDFTQPPANAGPGQITAGSTWNFQFWYRDPAGPGGTTFNLSDALSVTFTP